MTAAPRFFRRAAVNRRRAWRQSTRIVGALFLGALLAVRYWDPAPVEILRLKTLDLYQQLQPRATSVQPVVIVDIDERSLAAHGQWPWARTLMATLSAKLDATFAEIDRAVDIASSKETAINDLKAALLDEKLQALFQNQPSITLSDVCERVSVGHVGTTSKYYCDDV